MLGSALLTWSFYISSADEQNTEEFAELTVDTLYIAYFSIRFLNLRNIIVATLCLN